MKVTPVVTNAVEVLYHPAGKFLLSDLCQTEAIERTEPMEDDDFTPLSLKDLLYEIVLALVQYPGCVVVDEQINTDSSICLTVSVDQRDVGRVLGKQGRLAEALRFIFVAVAQSKGFRVYITVNAPPHNPTSNALSKIAGPRAFSSNGSNGTATRPLPPVEARNKRVNLPRVYRP